MSMVAPKILTDDSLSCSRASTNQRNGVHLQLSHRWSDWTTEPFVVWSSCLGYLGWRQYSVWLWEWERIQLRWWPGLNEHIRLECRSDFVAAKYQWHPHSQWSLNAELWIHFVYPKSSETPDAPFDPENRSCNSYLQIQIERK